VSPSTVLAAVAAGIVIILFHGMWVMGPIRDFWRWGNRGLSVASVAAMVALDLFLAGVLFALAGR